ncbi:MAG: nitric oxide synthase oxygenase [Acidobacteriota bacterium]
MIPEPQGFPTRHRELFAEAREFIAQFFEEVEPEGDLDYRLVDVGQEILETGTYTQTSAELLFGARVAWRNSTRCVGRHYWKALDLIDARDLSEPQEMFEAIVDYLRTSTNKGKIRSNILVFPQTPAGEPGIRIWNDQLIRYAGYRRKGGEVLGDSSQVEITEAIQGLGWTGGEGTAFDLLPIVIEVPGKDPEWFELPADAVLEVVIEHPDYPAFGERGYRWHAVPSISNMRLEAGGLSYTAAPFNGWYMGSEIGARNLADEQRYNLLPVMAEVMGLETRRESSLWRDRAMVELNVAVLHSFEKAGVKIVDHQTCTRHFVRFEEREAEANREVLGDWEWLVPPVSGSATPVFHRKYENRDIKPNYFYQGKPEGMGGGRCPFTGATADD